MVSDLLRAVNRFHCELNLLEQNLFLKNSNSTFVHDGTVSGAILFCKNGAIIGSPASV